jgi:chromosome segregation ATPase
MGSDDTADIGELLEKVEALAEELSEIRKVLEALDSVPNIVEKIESIGSQIEEMQASLEPLAKGDDITESLDTVKTAIDDMKEVQNSESIDEKVDKLASVIDKIEEGIHELSESKEAEVIIKKVDDILIGVSEFEVVSKKLDDLQGYIAGLSSIEEKVEDLTSSFQETQEIVGIIVRQLDDIERKYNQSIDKLNETADSVAKLVDAESKTQTRQQEKKDQKSVENELHTEPEKKVLISKTNLPSTIDALMERLLGLVNPQTEATEMAESLEEVRDQLTSMIQGHTPVLFQFGKKARELKSYPPTATLNENDIASLNKDIKSWTSKLKEIAKNS